TGFPASIHSTNIHLISYAAAVTPANWVGGTAPPGVSLAVANNSANNSIDVTLIAGAGKNLVWKDYSGDHTWNTTSLNWLDTATGLHTNFSTLDSVTFDDTGDGNITISQDVVPAQSGVGLLVSNNAVAYTFTGGGRILGGSAYVKTGTQPLTIDL